MQKFVLRLKKTYPQQWQVKMGAAMAPGTHAERPGHKYIRKESNGRGGWTYYYKQTFGVPGGVRSDIEREPLPSRDYQIHHEEGRPLPSHYEAPSGEKISAEEILARRQGSDEEKALLNHLYEKEKSDRLEREPETLPTHAIPMDVFEPNEHRKTYKYRMSTTKRSDTGELKAFEPEIHHFKHIPPPGTEDFKMVEEAYGRNNIPENPIVIDTGKTAGGTKRYITPEEASATTTEKRIRKEKSAEEGGYTEVPTEYKVFSDKDMGHLWSVHAEHQDKLDEPGGLEKVQKKQSSGMNSVFDFVSPGVEKGQEKYTERDIDKLLSEKFGGEIGGEVDFDRFVDGANIGDKSFADILIANVRGGAEKGGLSRERQDEFIVPSGSYENKRDSAKIWALNGLYLMMNKRDEADKTEAEMEKYNHEGSVWKGFVGWAKGKDKKEIDAKISENNKVRQLNPLLVRRLKAFNSDSTAKQVLDHGSSEEFGKYLGSVIFHEVRHVANKFKDHLERRETELPRGSARGYEGGPGIAATKGEKEGVAGVGEVIAPVSPYTTPGKETLAGKIDARLREIVGEQAKENPDDAKLMDIFRAHADVRSSKPHPFGSLPRAAQLAAAKRFKEEFKRDPSPSEASEYEKPWVNTARRVLGSDAFKGDPELQELHAQLPKLQPVKDKEKLKKAMLFAQLALCNYNLLAKATVVGVSDMLKSGDDFDGSKWFFAVQKTRKHIFDENDPAFWGMVQREYNVMMRGGMMEMPVDGSNVQRYRPEIPIPSIEQFMRMGNNNTRFVATQDQSATLDIEPI